MLLEHWFLGHDLRVDLSQVTRRWIAHLVTDPLVGPLQPWQGLYHDVMGQLGEFIEDPDGSTLPEDFGLAVGSAWQRQRLQAPERFDRCLYYLQAALQEYLEQSRTTRVRVETFFSAMLHGLHGADPAVVVSGTLPEVRQWLPTLPAAQQGLPAIAEAVVRAARVGGHWQEAALYWWDGATGNYLPLHVSGPFPPLEILQAATLHDQAPCQCEPYVDLRLPALRLWQPLLRGQGLLGLSREALMPVQLQELHAVMTFAAQTEVVLDQAEELARSQASRHQLSRQVVELATATSELTLVREIFQLVRQAGDAESLVALLLAHLRGVMVAARCELWLLDPAREGLEWRSACGGDTGTSRRPVTETAWLATGAALTLVPVLADETPGGSGRGRSRGRHKRLIMPICASDRWIGSIEFVRDATVSVFTEADRLLAESLAGFIAPLVQQLALQDQLTTQASLDVLTGLPHRLRLRQLLDQQLGQARREGQPFSLLLADIDGLDAYNQSLGFPVGDALLRHLGRQIAGCLADGARVGRWGGDEFLILLPHEGRPEALRTARRIYEVCCRRYEGNGVSIMPTVSLGIVTDEGDGADPEALLRAAQQEMQAAKGKRDQRLLAQFWEQDS
ncbi:MAG: sensor domain-containing diguanylate cyclase [Candidatus Sericytochromatia bacterium]|nr:sensor domain-containing diguanylate cyclase [Candidatus Sericytochromatia bacterium]